MPILSINVPTARTATIVAMADAYLDMKNIDRSAMTQVQRAQRYVTELLKEQYVRYRQEAVLKETQAAYTAAETAAKTEANDIT
jgi:hypothetical protein